MKHILVLLLLAVSAFAQAPAQTKDAPVYVTLWFDTEDYVLPQSDDAAKRLAEMLTRLGVKATFKLVGEKVRVLNERKRTDVIAALKKHEIGYHSNTHSMQPTIAVELQHMNWEEGHQAFFAREQSGVQDIVKTFGVVPSCYGQPGSSWVPQSYPALLDLGIKMYLDESNHVGINEQPFYYGGMLNVTKMRSNVVRMELSGTDNLAQAQAKFSAAAERLRGQGGGTISIYYHPCEFIHTEFWDGVNFRRGANPPREQWKLPRMKAAADSEKAFNDFEQYVKFIKKQRDAQFVTANELTELYVGGQRTRTPSRDEVLTLAKAVQKEITFHQFADASLSALDIYGILNSAFLMPELEKIHGSQAKASSEMAILAEVRPLFGPARAYTPTLGNKTLTQVSLAELRRAALARMADWSRKASRQGYQMPSEFWVATNSFSPQDYLATIAGAVERHLTTGTWPDPVPVRKGVLGFEKYVAEDATKLWGWVIFPEGFHAPKIMELARLQAWTLKPALLKRQQ
jgi:hypothetical protein